MASYYGAASPFPSRTTQPLATAAADGASCADGTAALAAEPPAALAAARSGAEAAAAWAEARRWDAGSAGAKRGVDVGADGGVQAELRAEGVPSPTNGRFGAGGGWALAGLGGGGGRGGTEDLCGPSGSFYERAKRLRNRDLRDKIRGQADVGGVLDLVQSRGEYWDAVGVSTALHTAAKKYREGAGARPDFEADERWHHLRRLVQVKLSGGEARNLANNAWSLATLLCEDWPLLGDIAAGLIDHASELKIQEAANSCWAFATVKLRDAPLFDRLAEEIMPKAIGGVNQDLTNTMWAFATVLQVHEPLFKLLSDIAGGKVAEFKPQELANSIWALATASVKHDALVLRISRQSIEKFSEFRTQNLANFVWAYAKLAHKEDAVAERVQTEAMRRLDEFSPQDLSTVLWSFATMLYRDDRFMKPYVAQLQRRCHGQDLQPQHASNTLWALATVSFRDVPCFADMTAGALRQLGSFKAQEVSNIVWACASASYRDKAFADGVAREFLARLAEFDPQGVGNSTWALSVLETSVREVYGGVWGKLGEASCLMHCSDKGFSMLVAAFFRSGEKETAWRLLDRCVTNRINPGVAAFGYWLHHCRHVTPEPAREIRVLLLLAKHRPCRHLIVNALNMVALRLIELGDVASAWEVVERMQGDGPGDAVTDLLAERLLHGGLAAGAASGPRVCNIAALFDWHVPATAPRPPRGVAGSLRCDYEKECHVYRYVLANARRGDPQSVLECIERFSFEGNGWLKIAGDEKGVVLDDLVGALAPTIPPRLVLEFGLYVGYSSTRFARLIRAGSGGGRIVSVEVDPIHCCIARSMFEFAGVADAVTVYCGYSEDAIPHLRQATGGLAADVVFMDQRGTRFHVDLQLLEDHGLLSPGCIVAADNVLKPGAPHFLWHLQSSEQYDLTVVSVREFAAERVEDWMVVAKYTPRPGGPLPADSIEFPECLSEIAFRTDRARQRSCAGDRPGEVGEDEWACHSQEVRRAYAAAGICPRVVNIARREDGSAFVEW